MKPLIIAAVVGSALAAGGAFVAGDFGAARSAFSESSGASGPVRQAAAAVRTVTLRVDNMFCAACPYIVKQSLAAVPGVKDVTVSYRKKTAVVTFDDSKTNVEALTEATFDRGYPSRVL